MLARSVSVILIAVVIACPMWCGNGVCHADQCCSAKQSSYEVCPVQGTDHCCCDQSSPDSDHPCPSKTSGKSSCQGVCGGVIFGKPIKLNDVADSFIVSLMDTEALVVVRLVERNIHGIEHYRHCRGGNHGRFLRTLHMSFLC